MTTELNADDFELVRKSVLPTFKNKLLTISNLGVGKNLQFQEIDILGLKIGQFLKIAKLCLKSAKRKFFYELNFHMIQGW